MTRSTDRILTTHAGSLPRSDDLRKMIFARADGEPYDQNELTANLRQGVADVVQQQIDCGIDIVNDGELGKTSFNNYVRERLAGFETREFRPGKDPVPLNIAARDNEVFPEYFAKTQGGFAWRGYSRPQVICVEPLTYVGRNDLNVDIENFQAALKGKNVAGGYLNANTPGTIEHWLRNEYYKTQEEFVYAIAEAMREEYTAIVDAGFMLQIDDPDLPDAWQMYPGMSFQDYRKYAEMRVDALNHALRDIPVEKIQLHVCWGSFHGPHQNDVPLEQILDIVFRVRAGRFSVEASNPVHEHEWHVFENHKLPDGAVIVPGVVGHSSDHIEHPQLVADRLERYAKLVGRENVIAGTDCGLGPRVGHPTLAWAKLKSISQGAKIASDKLWGRG